MYQHIFRKIRPTIQISEEDMKAFYEERKSDIPKDKTYEDEKQHSKLFITSKKGDVIKGH